MKTTTILKPVPTSYCCPPTGLGDLVAKLGKKDAAEQAAAAQALYRLGKSATTRLVQEAAAPGKTIEHRVRILDVIAEIGGRLEHEDAAQLAGLFARKAPSLREKVLEVSLLLSHGGPPGPVSDAYLAYSMDLTIWNIVRRFGLRTKRVPTFEAFCRAADAANRRLGRPTPSLVAMLHQMTALGAEDARQGVTLDLDFRLRVPKRRRRKKSTSFSC